MIRQSLILILLLSINSVPGYSQNLPFACAGSTESYGVQGQTNSLFFWEVDGGQIVDGQNNDTIVLRWDYQRRVHSLVVTEHSEFGCFGTPVEANLNIQAPVADIGDEEEVCADNTVTFDASTSYLTEVTYLWPDGSTSPEFSTGSEGFVWVRITGSDGCSDYDSSFLTVNPLPQVDLGKDTALCGTAVLLVDAGNFSSYEWSTGDIINPVSVDGSRSSDENLWVRVTDENGCQGSDTMILQVCDVFQLFNNFPNTITPGDKNGQNDRWIIPNIELFPDAVLEIYDRWGRLIFRTTDVYNNPWNGESMAGNEMPMDAYYYVLDVKLHNSQPLTGYVNLIR